MMDLLLETGYDEDTLKLLQGNKDDLEHFFTELVYMKSKDDAVMSSVLRAKLGQDWDWKIFVNGPEPTVEVFLIDL